MEKNTGGSPKEQNTDFILTSLTEENYIFDIIVGGLSPPIGNRY